MPRTRARIFGPRFFAIVALLATIAQIGVTVAPLIEEHDGRMASHVENYGTRTHFAHNESTCAACQARLIHGATTAPNVPLVGRDPTSDACRIGTPIVASVDSHPQENPRAPPSVI